MAPAGAASALPVAAAGMAAAAAARAPPWLSADWSLWLALLPLSLPPVVWSAPGPEAALACCCAAVGTGDPSEGAGAVALWGAAAVVMASTVCEPASWLALWAGGVAGAWFLTEIRVDGARAARAAACWEAPVGPLAALPAAGPGWTEAAGEAVAVAAGAAADPAVDALAALLAGDAVPGAPSAAAVNPGRPAAAGACCGLSAVCPGGVGSGAPLGASVALDKDGSLGVAAVGVWTGANGAAETVAASVPSVVGAVVLAVVGAVVAVASAAPASVFAVPAAALRLWRWARWPVAIWTWLGMAADPLAADPPAAWGVVVC
jgi:hypothetical protein